jgi:hypothetical protein
MKSWSSTEANNMNFNDKRLNKRVEKLLEALGDNSSGSIPEACESHSQTLAAYRFFDNDNVTPEIVLQGFYKTTQQRMKNHKEILFISDATSYVFTGRKTLPGIGVLRNFKARGFIMHSTLAVSTNNVALGLVHQDTWGRKEEEYGKRKLRAKLPVNKKESYKWIVNMLAAQSSLSDDQKGIYICDRDADMFELFAAERKSNLDLLVRSSHNRTLSNSSMKIQDHLDNVNVSGIKNVIINRSDKRKKREALLEIKYSKVTIRDSKDRNRIIELNIIEAKEKISSEINDPIHWKLFTTINITNLDDAIKCIDYYVQRWLIERYHFTLKSGCTIEELQLEDNKRMFVAIAIYCIVAWRLMEITYAARNDPDKSAADFFEKQEWEALCCFNSQSVIPPKDPPTIKIAIQMLAKLGGFLGRKLDGDPGMKVIWRGLRKLEGFVEAYILFSKSIERCV